MCNISSFKLQQSVWWIREQSVHLADKMNPNKLNNYYIKIIISTRNIGKHVKVLIVQYGSHLLAISYMNIISPYCVTVHMLIGRITFYNYFLSARPIFYAFVTCSMIYHVITLHICLERLSRQNFRIIFL